MDSLFSDKLASPSGAIWLLFLASSHFFLSSALFALHPVVLAVSDELSVRFCMTFAHESTISSSTSSLRIAWVGPSAFTSWPPPACSPTKSSQAHGSRGPLPRVHGILILILSPRHFEWEEKAPGKRGEKEWAGSPREATQQEGNSSFQGG
jgi:hypothetical protein